MTVVPYVTKTGMIIDPARLKRNGETLLFTPFRVESTRSLSLAYEEEVVAPETELLVAVRSDRHVVALLRQQMAYHHVAQGQMGDEPWLVFF